MITKSDYLDPRNTGPAIIVEWDEKYSTGIELIDSQHKQLVHLTNELYQACMGGDEELGTVFKEAMGRMVEYVRFHFGAEQEMLQRIKYPNYTEHVKLHTDLIKQIIEASNNFNKGKHFIANRFVMTLRDWILGHIGYYDKVYAAYVADQKKKGLLTDQQITG
jgi:hemerythrin